MDSDVRVQLFGQVTLFVNGTPPDLGGARQRAFLSFLATQANKTVSRQEIVDAVWGTDPPPSVTSSIHTYVARVRRVLEPERQPRGLSKALEFHGLGYRLNIDTDYVDTHLFESRLKKAKGPSAAPFESSLESYENALHCWHGRPLIGIPGPFAEMERSRLEELYRSALEDRYSLLISAHRLPEAVQGLFNLAKQYPLRERTRDLLIMAYYLSGRRSEALMEFQSLRQDLDFHLGVEPNPDLQKKHLMILRGESITPPPPVHISSAPPTKEGAAPPPTRTPFQLPRDTPVLVGRDSELRLLRSLVQSPAEPNKAPFLHIHGPPGVGKSSLAVRFAHELSDSFPDGQLYVDLRETAASGRPLSPDKALGDMLFGLGEHVSGPVPTDRLAGLFRSRTSSKRMLILLDNAVSEEQVRALLPGSQHCGVIVTSRTKMTGLAIREGVQRLSLGPLKDEDSARSVLQSAIRLLSEQGPPRQWCLPEPAEIMDVSRQHSNIPALLPLLAERLAKISSSSPRPTKKMLDGLFLEEHHQSCVFELISWSYRLLPTETALVFRAVGLSNAETLDPWALSAMLGDEVADPAEHLALLCEHNLLQEERLNRVSMPRYLRIYARQVSRLKDSGETRALWLRRLADYYVKATEHVHGFLTGAGDLDTADCPLPRFETREQAQTWLQESKPMLCAVMRDAKAE